LRLRSESQRRAAAMQEKLLANLPANHPLRRDAKDE